MRNQEEVQKDIMTKIMEMDRIESQLKKLLIKKVELNSELDNLKIEYRNVSNV